MARGRSTRFTHPTANRAGDLITVRSNASGRRYVVDHSTGEILAQETYSIPDALPRLDDILPPGEFYAGLDRLPVAAPAASNRELWNRFYQRFPNADLSGRYRTQRYSVMESRRRYVAPHLRSLFGLIASVENVGLDSHGLSLLYKAGSA